jgi:hypothetical protein
VPPDFAEAALIVEDCVCHVVLDCGTNSRFVILQRVGSGRRPDVHNIRLETQQLAERRNVKPLMSRPNFASDVVWPDGNCSFLGLGGMSRLDRRLVYKLLHFVAAQRSTSDPNVYECADWNSGTVRGDLRDFVFAWKWSKRWSTDNPGPQSDMIDKSARTTTASESA